MPKDILTAIFGKAEIPEEEIDLTEKEQISMLNKFFAETNQQKMAGIYLEPGALLQEVSFAGMLSESSKHRPLLFMRYIDSDDPWLQMGALVHVLTLQRVDRLDCVVMFIDSHGIARFLPHNSTLLVPFQERA